MAAFICTSRKMCIRDSLVVPILSLPDHIQAKVDLGICFEVDVYKRQPQASLILQPWPLRIVSLREIPD